MKPIPAWVVTGPLGSGKTTVLARALAGKPPAENWVVLLNEYTDAGIDALTVAAAARGAYDVRLIPGGCLCCTGEADFRRTLRELVESVRPDRILIEPSGIGHPGGVIDELLAHEAAGALVLETVLGLLDPQAVEALAQDRPDEILRAILELADVLVLSKADLAPPAVQQSFARLASASFPIKRWSGPIVGGDLSVVPPSAWQADVPDRRAGRQTADPHAKFRHTSDSPDHAHDEAVSTPVGIGERRDLHRLDYRGAQWRFPRAVTFSESRLLAALARRPVAGDTRLGVPARLKAVLRIDEDAWVLVQIAAGRLEVQPTAWRRDQRIEVQCAPGMPWDCAAWDRLWLQCTTDRDTLARWYSAGVAAVHGSALFVPFLRQTDSGWRFERAEQWAEIRCPDRSAGGRLRVLAIGKAASALALGFVAAVGGEAVDELLVLTKAGHADRSRLDSLGLRRLEVLEGDHPIAGERSASATARVLEWIGLPTSADRFVVLLTGGASALLAAPVPGLTLSDKQARIRTLMQSGASIAELNRERSRLSVVKGGRLAARMAPASITTFALSDVEGDDPRVIGSGPTVGDVPTPGCYAIVGTLDHALAAIAAAARKEGWTVIEGGRVLYGDLEQSVARVARDVRALSAPAVWIAGGEPVVRVTGTGVGGRAQEFALRLAQQIDGREDCSLLVAGTDGTDGPTDAAGGFADGEVMSALRNAGVEPAESLRENDSHHALRAAGALFITGPTGTNVADVVIALVRESSPPPSR